MRQHGRENVMSYPPPRYHGTAGEVSAIHRLEGQEPELSFPNGNKVHYLATAASTEGKFGLYRWDMSPEPSGADPTSTRPSRSRSSS